MRWSGGASAITNIKLGASPLQLILNMVLRRLGVGLATLFVVSLLVFFAVEALPGDLAQALLGQSATPEALEALRTKLGLDLPAHTRYLKWLGGYLNGDLGTSLSNGQEISRVIGQRLDNTMFLAALSAAISIPLALVLGVLAAAYRNSIFDRLVNSFVLTTISTPEFFLAYILISVLSVQLGWFPSISNINDSLKLSERVFRSLLPALTLTLVVTAHMMRMTRAAIISLLSSPYIEMALLKGTRHRFIILRHALPNALAPIINIVVLNLAYMITGVVIIEVVYVYPGLGQLLVDSVSKRDIPVVQSCCLIFAATYILLNLLADILSILSNPRLLHRS